MNTELTSEYQQVIKNGGFIERKPGLIEVSGREAVQFLNGLITNDAAKLESYSWMLAAFPNAQGRLLAVARVLRFDDKFIFVTEEAAREKVYQNLFRFTFAGDFFVKDLSDEFSCLSVRGAATSNFKYKIPAGSEIVWARSGEESGFIIENPRADGFDVFVPKSEKESFINELKESSFIEISAELGEILRIENGIPKYGIDMDESTIVSELGLPDLISYNKGCYIGQEIVARIHFRGHVAKQLTGLIFDVENAEINSGDEIKSVEGKNAGRITSVIFSPKLGKTIALAYVRYDYLAEGTELKIGDLTAKVKNLPFIE
jgi:folate-binding protein YgfZ